MVDFRWEYSDLLLIYSILAHYVPGIDLDSNRNEYQGKGGLCVKLPTLQPSCTDCLAILGALTSSSTKGLFRFLKGKLYLYLYLISTTSSVRKERTVAKFNHRSEIKREKEEMSSV
jgi:hypothetical protein